MEAVEPKVYAIADEEGNKREFTQKAPVILQLKQIKALIKETDFNFADFDLLKLLDQLTDADAVPKFLAIVLCEKGKKLIDKDIEELKDFFNTNADMNFISSVVKDFFVINDILAMLQGQLPALVSAVSKTLSTTQMMQTETEVVQ